MIGYRHCDRRYPFFWESAHQPEGRWNRADEGPVQYLADTPDGAWAEFLRHEEIVEEADLAGISRALWAVEVDVDPSRTTEPALPPSTLVGDERTYGDCQAEADRVRSTGAVGLIAPSAALRPGAASGHRVEGGLVDGTPRDGVVMIIFGSRADAVGWRIVDDGRPPAGLLGKVRYPTGRTG